MAPADSEDHLPGWFDPYDHVQVSEFASWHDVALWADTLFQMNAASLPHAKLMRAIAAIGAAVAPALHAALADDSRVQAK